MRARGGRCALCGKEHNHLYSVGALHQGLQQRIAGQLEEPGERRIRICRNCLNQQRISHSLERLRQERGELGAIETQIAQQAASHAAVAQNVQLAFETHATRGERIADRVAAVGGSWTFLIVFFVALAAWMAVNAMRALRFDPYPFILLNLVLSTLAAVQAPIIMMSQNRLASRDRAQADEDFRTNLKAELEVASLHEKLDHLLHAQWEQLIEMQEVQLDLLEQISERTSHPDLGRHTRRH
jgi:uncharacterized membrane protein